MNNLNLTTTRGDRLIEAHSPLDVGRRAGFDQATSYTKPWDTIEKAQGYAEKIMGQIEERGYYARTLDRYAGRLAEETGYPKEEMKAIIVSRFDQAYGRDPYSYLNEQRARRGLPTREAAPDTGHEPEPTHEP